MFHGRSGGLGSQRQLLLLQLDLHGSEGRLQFADQLPEFTALPLLGELLDPLREFLHAARADIARAGFDRMHRVLHAGKITRRLRLTCGKLPVMLIGFRNENR